MSGRHRQFSLRSSRSAITAGNIFEAASSQDEHGSGASGEALQSRLQQADLRSRRRLWVLTAGAVAPTTPMWTSRTAWCSDVAAWASGAAGKQTLRRFHVTCKMLLCVSGSLALFADGASGRHCAVTNARVARVARCSPRTVSTVRAVLAQARFAVEAQRGTGSSTTPTQRRRPSIWHLTSRRPPVDNRQFCDLPTFVDVSSSPTLSFQSPSVSLCAPQEPSTQESRRRRRRSTSQPPRSLHTQRIAGWLASTAVGLGQRKGLHVVGQLCDALQASHLELSAWTGKTLIQALDEDMRRRGATWPDRISSPGPFLAKRLAQLPSRPVERPVPRTIGAAPVECAHSAGRATAPPSDAQVAARSRIREILSRKSPR